MQSILSHIWIQWTNMLYTWLWPLTAINVVSEGEGPSHILPGHSLPGKQHWDVPRLRRAGPGGRRPSPRVPAVTRRGPRLRPNGAVHVVRFRAMGAPSLLRRTTWREEGRVFVLTVLSTSSASERWVHLRFSESPPDEKRAASSS